MSYNKKGTEREKETDRREGVGRNAITDVPADESAQFIRFNNSILKFVYYNLYYFHFFQ